MQRIAVPQFSSEGGQALKERRLRVEWAKRIGVGEESRVRKEEMRQYEQNEESGQEEDDDLGKAGLTVRGERCSKRKEIRRMF